MRKRLTIAINRRVILIKIRDELQPCIFLGSKFFKIVLIRIKIDEVVI